MRTSSRPHTRQDATSSIASVSSVGRAAAAAEAAAANGEQHWACKLYDAHDAEGHAVSTEPHLGFIEDLASLIDIQEEATVSP